MIAEVYPKEGSWEARVLPHDPTHKIGVGDSAQAACQDLADKLGIPVDQIEAQVV